MHDLFREMERVCERNTKELHDFLDRIEQNKNTISPADLEILCKLVDIAKNSKSTMKKIIEIDEMMDANQNGYSGMYSGDYMTQPVWDKRYSGNSYHGQYTIATGATGDGYSGRRMGRRYSGNAERESMRQELDDMLQNSRDDREAEVIRKLIARM